MSLDTVCPSYFPPRPFPTRQLTSTIISSMSSLCLGATTTGIAMDVAMGEKWLLLLLLLLLAVVVVVTGGMAVVGRWLMILEDNGEITWNFKAPRGEGGLETALFKLESGAAGPRPVPVDGVEGEGPE